jgi:hypothetical protein
MPWNAKIDSGRKCADRAGSDYVAARRACGNHLQHGEEGDLSAKLEEALRSGWSIEALKAYAFSIWQQTASDDVTDAAWRLAVEFADSNGCSGGRNFLKRFSADPESYLVRVIGQRKGVTFEHNENRFPRPLSSPLQGQRTTSR